MPSPTSERSPSSRDAILDAALETFYTRGYGSTTMSEIRRTAGVSTGSLYHHFEGKEHLAAALFASGIGTYQKGFLRVLLGVADAEGGIRAGVSFHLRWARQHRPMSRFLIGMLDADVVAVSTEETTRRTREFTRDVHRWLMTQSQAGAVRVLPERLYYPVWIGPAQELLRQWMRDRAPAPSPAIEAELGHAAWAALRAVPS